MPIDYSRGNWIQTFGHHSFFPFAPKIEDIFIEDIAHALSMLCRFTGHVREFYCVSQHSVIVSQHCSEENKLWGLLHDAPEAYITDLSRPVKHHPKLAPYRKIEKDIMKVVCKKFDLPLEEPKEVKILDCVAGITEARQLLGPLLPGWDNKIPSFPEEIIPLEHREAEKLFLEQFYLLYKEK